MLKYKILFKLTGSIACFKACQVISRLVQEGHQVQVVCTPHALEFVGIATLEGLTGRPVLVNMFAKGHPMDHIEFTKWADLILLCPATANVINKMSMGIADDLVTTLFIAHDFKKPYFVAPAMNVNMWNHPATQSSVKKLQSWGVRVLDTEKGMLACGDVGEGRLLDPNEIYRQIMSALAVKQRSRGQVLITSGGTAEKIDRVRSIVNLSTGRTGATIADEFIKMGYDVNYIHSLGAILPTKSCELTSFETATDLENQLKTLLTERKFVAVIHLAAVSDYHVAKVEVGGKEHRPAEFEKIDSSGQISLHLAKNKKLVNHLREWASAKDFYLVAFKLTSNESEELVREKVFSLSKSSTADLVVHNDLSEINKVSGVHMFSLYRGQQKVAQCENAKDLSFAIEKYVSLQNAPQEREMDL